MTAHPAVPNTVSDKLQEPLNEPVLLDDRAKDPVGVIGVPGEVSATVTVQVEGLLTTMGVVQETATDTLR